MIAKIINLFRRRRVVLRNEKSDDDLRYLAVKLRRNGDLVFEGQDLGRAVEEFFGCREYEWYYTVKAEHVPLFENAMGRRGNLLGNIQRKFRGDEASKVHEFLESNGIPFEKWSRIGD